MGFAARSRLAVAAAGIVFVMLSLAFPGIRDWTMAILGDDVRNELVSLYSSVTERDANTADLEPIANVGVSPLGINVFLEQEVEEWKVRRTLQMARDAGFHWIKQQVRWTEIEIPEKGEYFDTKNDVADTWAKYDRIVDLARAYGLELILRLDTSPSWARSTAKEETPPERLEDYGDFVSAVVGRYRGKVRHYQIWNEPNLAYEWGAQQPNATEYVAMLKIAYQRAKEADPGSVIIAAALAPTIENSARALNDLVFLQQMYDAGGGQWFDIMSANPYGLRTGPDDRRLGDGSDVNFSRPVLVREAMVRNGDASKPIWAAEMGWNALPLDFAGEALWGRVTREQQARYTVRAYQRMKEEWPWMGVAALWHFRMVHDVNRDQALYYFGIVDNDFTPYPTYEAVRQFSAAKPAIYPGFHRVNNEAITFSAGWQPVQEPSYIGRPTMESAEGDASLRLTFVGSDLDVIAKSQRVSRLLIKIDGGSYAANRLERGPDGSAFLDLVANKGEPENRVAVARGLPWGRHTLEVRKAGGSDVVTIGGFFVGGSPPNTARTLAIVLAFLATLLAARLAYHRCLSFAIISLEWLVLALRQTRRLHNPIARLIRTAKDGCARVIRPAFVLLRWLWPSATDDMLEGRRHYRVAFAIGAGLVLLVALGLRLLRLDAQSLWYDEGTTAALAQRSIAMITRDAAGDIHPPLYYYALHFWTGLTGLSEFSLRLLSVLFGVLTISVTYALGKRVVNIPTAFAASILAALSPVLVYYSQEARMYAQLALLAGLSVLLLQKLLDQSPSHRRLLWVCYVAVTAAMLYTHYFAATVLLAETVYLAIHALALFRTFPNRHSAPNPSARFAIHWLLTQGLIVSLFVPWLAIAGDQLIGWPAISSPLSFDTLLQRVFRVFVFGIGSEASLTPRRELALLAILAVGAAYLLRVFPPRPGRVALLTLFGATPVVAMYVMSLQRPAYNPKFLLPAVLPFEIVVAAGIAGATALLTRVLYRRVSLTRRLPIFAVNLCVALALLAVAVYPAKASLQAYYFDAKYSRDDYRGLAAYIMANCAGSDAIVLNAPGQIEIFEYYYSGSLERYPIPRQRPIDEVATAAELNGIASSHAGIWLVLWATVESDPGGFVERWLDSHGDKLLDRPFGGVRLLRYALTAGEPTAQSISSQVLASRPPGAG